MTMKAQIRTDALGNITVHMQGGLDYENTQPLREELMDLTKTNPTAIVTIDLNRLDFVGSSGINHFVDTVKILSKDSSQIRLSNVASEFIKVFKLYNFEDIEKLIEEFNDDETEHLNYKFGNRKNTFQN
ncbi:MAG: STAS domain-containing protein [Bacteriovoracaceae bacterium]|jgi:anti-sigma B factor antagonist|nr:STAS domain-containing protein [Bacteriovoracaceae bacterium]